ncbi:MAG: hypothetical protein CMM50_18220 [Rhodospirillaceae bacterium]|mgnify:CR=1 FL=1|nr:hypothetical protein [Rhodospirillaceae bacterium]
MAAATAPSGPSPVPVKGSLPQALLGAFERRNAEEQLRVLSRGKAIRSFTGSELGSAVEAKARLLRDWLGPGPRSLVLSLPAGESFLVALLACLVAEIVAVPVPLPRRGSTSGRFAHVARDSGASAILCLEENAELLHEALALTRDDRRIAPLLVAMPLDASTLPDLATLTGAAPHGTAVIQYTSGSTRLPKGACVTGQNILANCDLVMRHWGMCSTTRMLNWLPHYHDMGLMGGILYPILSGGRSFQMSPYDFIRDPAVWLRTIAEARADFSGAPAFAFADVIRRVRKEDMEGLDLSCWDRAFCGAEPIPAGLLDDFHAHLESTGLRRSSVFACYGMAEMTLFAAGVPGEEQSDDDVEPEATTGCVLNPETRAGLCIVDPERGAEMEDGRVGEIWLKGPSQGDGYLNSPEETRRQFGRCLPGRSGRWFRTGDLGAVRGGRLFVNGRLKDILISRGHKISAPEVEWLACTADPVLNPLAAAAFMADPNEGGRAMLVAETYAREDGWIGSERLKDRIRRSVLGEWGLDLTEIVFVPRGTLARTTSGKIRRQAVAQHYREGRFAPFAGQGETPCP